MNFDCGQSERSVRASGFRDPALSTSYSTCSQKHVFWGSTHSIPPVGPSPVGPGDADLGVGEPTLPGSAGGRTHTPWVRWGETPHSLGPPGGEPTLPGSTGGTHTPWVRGRRTHTSWVRRGGGENPHSLGPPGHIMFSLTHSTIAECTIKSSITVKSIFILQSTTLCAASAPKQSCRLQLHQFDTKLL